MDQPPQPPDRPGCSKAGMQLGLAAVYLLMGVLQPLVVGTEFIESCGYPVNASYIVFFALAQLHLVVYCGMSENYLDNPGGKIHQFAILISASTGFCFGSLFLVNFVDVLLILNSCDYGKARSELWIRIYYVTSIFLSFVHSVGTIVFAFMVRNSYAHPMWLADMDPRNLRETAKILNHLRIQISQAGYSAEAFRILVTDYSPLFFSWDDRLQDPFYFTYLSYALNKRVLICLKLPRLFNWRCDFCNEPFESIDDVLCLGIAWRTPNYFHEAFHHQQQEHVHPECFQKGSISGLSDPLLKTELQKVLQRHWDWLMIPR